MELCIANNALCGEHVFDDAKNSLLPLSRQATDFVENATRFTDRSAFAIRSGGAVEKHIHGNAENLGEQFHLVGTQGYRPAFPACIRVLRHAQLASHLSLGKAACFARGVQALAEWRARL